MDSDEQAAHGNDGSERSKGNRSEEIGGRRVACFDRRDGQDSAPPARDLDLALRTARFEDWRRRDRKTGSRVRASIVIPVIQADGDLVGFAKINRDGTLQRKQDRRLETMAANLRLVLACLPYGACLLDEEARIVLSNPAFAELLGVPKKTGGLGSLLREVIGRRAKAVGAQDPGDVLAVLDRPGPSQGSRDLTLGETILHLDVRPTESHGWVVTFEDVTERRIAETAAHHRDRHDALTGLANEDALNEHLGALLARQGSNEAGERRACILLALDLDRLKSVNDTHGHPTGDAILRGAAHRIETAMRPGDFVCRLGGDTFVVVVEGHFDARQARAIGERLRVAIIEPFVFDDAVFEIDVNIGIASSLDAGDTPTELVASAECALYKAKREGGVSFYDTEVGLAVLKLRTMELRLRSALGAGEFCLVYQPICSTVGAGVIGFEALIRWTQSAGDMVPPAEFIPLAETLGLMAQIGGWVLETACREAATWPDEMVVAVNVSATQMHDPCFVERVAAALAESGLDPRRLEIEITETAMITDHDLTLSVLTRLRKMGVLIALDDFGTGYSSLSVLRTLPFTRLKIDRSFVCDLATNGRSIAIVRGLMRMSRDLGLAVTVEGVETQEQRQILLEEGCAEVQGYLFARPMPRADIRAFLTSNAAKPLGHLRSA